VAPSGRRVHNRQDQMAVQEPSLPAGILVGVMSAQPTALSADTSSPLVEPLIAWFAAHSRDLPWRRPGIGAWPVLVSEVMLQQTPVNRVLGPYALWLDRWPTPAHLAADSAGDAVRMWGKLGYPRRALRLHACAVMVRDEYGGVVPGELTDLLRLPGVGAYTARAVLAFAYGRRAAVVDTNVRRVLARAVTGQAEPGPISIVRDLAAMESVLPCQDKAAASFCAAVMELGAVCCTAAKPRCDDCPVSHLCAWRDSGFPPALEKPARSQPFAGTDRQVRGLLLDVLRASEEPVQRAALDIAWPAPQRDRALASLIADGLIEIRTDGLFALPS
jgi:A/G-specific adenine glycosylase